MSKPAFDELVDILGIVVDKKKSRQSTGGNHSISPTMIVAIGLQFLGGEKPKSLADTFGTSISSIHCVIDVFLHAVDYCIHPSLSTDLLSVGYDKRIQIAREWNKRSTAFGAFFGCLGAIDGWLCTTEKPEDVHNPGDYFSGHYQKFGLNVQAMCDANLQFTYLSVSATGGTNNSRAFCKLYHLQKWLSSLADGYFCIGNNAYQLSNKLLIPFSGPQRLNPQNDSYNFFYLNFESELRWHLVG